MSIREIRESLGLTQAEFGRRFGLNLRSIQNWEQGVRSTPDYVLFMISRILELEEQLGK